MKEPDSTARRRASSIERVAEPNVLVTYLCGYSLRTCTLFILWIDVILIITFFVMVILVSSLMHFYIITQHQANETKYTFLMNNQNILTIDLHSSISIKSSIEFAEIGKRILQIVLSSACVYSFVSISGLIAVYYNNHELLIPYLVLLTSSLIWVSSFTLLDVLFIAFQYIKPVWLILFTAISYFILKLYELMVIYSYYHHYSGFAKHQIRTPPYLTTQSPMQLPEAPVPESLLFKKNVESEKSPRDKKQ